MENRTMLYHSTDAPEGREFDSTAVSLELLAREGWVDSPAKIGINVWGDDAEDAVREQHKKYQSGEIPGIDGDDNMSENKRCAIWGTLASDESVGEHDVRLVDSLRAGGKYLIAQTAITLLAQCDERLKARLTSWLIDQRRWGIECPEITEIIIKDAERFRALTVHRRADRLLQYIGNHTTSIGSFITFIGPDVCSPAIAWSESIGMDEVKFLLDYLKQQGWLEGSESTNDKYILTVEGYARLAELETTDTESEQAFVAMWFDASMAEVWEKGFKPGIEDAGYKPIRIDQIEHSNKVDDEIIAEIRRSRFVVADFTQGDDGARGGVYYEAGFAYGLNIRVIFTCRKDTLDKIHFDTRQYNHIVWETSQDLRQRLAKRISAVIGDGPRLLRDSHPR